MCLSSAAGLGGAQLSTTSTLGQSIDQGRGTATRPYSVDNRRGDGRALRRHE